MIDIKYVLFVSIFLIGCGGGGSNAINNTDVNEIIDQIDTSNDSSNSFASLEKKLPFGLDDETGASTAISMALFDSFTIYPRSWTYIFVPVPLGSVDVGCEFGGNATTNFTTNQGIEDFDTYERGVIASNCRYDENMYVDGSVQSEGSSDTRTNDLVIDIDKFTLNKYSRNGLLGSIPTTAPLSSKLEAVPVYISGTAIFNGESDRRINEIDTFLNVEESGWILDDDDGMNTFQVSYADRELERKTTSGSSSSDDFTVEKTYKADFNSSWAMTNDAQGNAVVRAAGSFAGVGEGFGYDYTFPEGNYNLSIKVLSPVVRDSRSISVFPLEGSILLELSSHDISAVISFSGGAQISITTNGENVVTNLDKFGQVIQ